MILFATVGTRLEPFDRLVDVLDAALDDLAADGIDVTGLLQQGSCTRGSRHLESRVSVGRSEFVAWMRRADAVVCHAGVGALRAALDGGHQPLVMARKHRHREVLNDHQDEILDALSRRGLVHPFTDAPTLAALLQAMHACPRTAAPEPAPLPVELTDALARGAKQQRASILGRSMLPLLAALGPRLETMRLHQGP
jgi:UDP-N-acetylglucosamine transferase subunit ALG13